MLYLKDNDFDSFKTTILDKNPFAMRLALQQRNKMVQSEADLEELFSKYNIIYDRYFTIEQQWIIISIDDFTNTHGQARGVAEM